jgi:hypothetical protein
MNMVVDPAVSSNDLRQQLHAGHLVIGPSPRHDFHGDFHLCVIGHK